MAAVCSVGNLIYSYILYITSYSIIPVIIYSIYKQQKQQKETATYRILHILTISFYVATMVALLNLPMPAICLNIYNLTYQVGYPLLVSAYYIHWVFTMNVLFTR